MNGAIGQSVVLVSHANAFLAGHDVSLSLEANDWFKGFGSVKFGGGQDETKIIAHSFDEWFRWLKMAEFTRCYLWVEPNEKGMKTIMNTPFIGGVHIAPVTCTTKAATIWHCKPRSVGGANGDRPWSSYYGAFRLLDSQVSVQASVQDAAAALDYSARKMTAIAKGHKGLEPFVETISDGLSALREIKNSRPLGEREEPFASLFPPGLYPKESTLLVEASLRCWVFGGMGWWNDTGFAEKEKQAEFEEISLNHYDAIFQCLYAACNVQPGQEAGGKWRRFFGGFRQTN